MNKQDYLDKEIDDIEKMLEENPSIPIDGLITQYMDNIRAGICPESGYTFEKCSQSICDCMWQGGVPWSE